MNDDYDDVPATTEIPYAALAPRKHSGLGIASFVLALALALIMFGLFVVAGVMEASTPGGLDEESPQAVAVGLGIIGTGFGNLVGLILGIAGLCQSGRMKVFAAIGVLLNGFILAGTAATIALGLSM